MSVNCVSCVKNTRTGYDLLCNECRYKQLLVTIKEYLEDKIEKGGDIHLIPAQSDRIFSTIRRAIVMGEAASEEEPE